MATGGVNVNVQDHSGTLCNSEGVSFRFVSLCFRHAFAMLSPCFSALLPFLFSLALDSA
jgi:hypothetical protein